MISTVDADRPTVPLTATEPHNRPLMAISSGEPGLLKASARAWWAPAWGSPRFTERIWGLSPCQPRLADPPGTGQREQPGSAQRPAHLGKLDLPPDELGQLTTQPASPLRIHDPPAENARPGRTGRQ